MSEVRAERRIWAGLLLLVSSVMFLIGIVLH